MDRFGERNRVAQKFLGQAKHRPPVEELANSIMQNGKARSLYVERARMGARCQAVRNKLIATRPTLWLVVSVVRNAVSKD